MFYSSTETEREILGSSRMSSCFLPSRSTDSYIEVLDGSRVHPETYEWARKMAVDALEYDESAEDANPAGALEEILENPERLKDLDLDAFAEELERQVRRQLCVWLYVLCVSPSRVQTLTRAFPLPPSLRVTVTRASRCMTSALSSAAGIRT